MKAKLATLFTIIVCFLASNIASAGTWGWPFSKVTIQPNTLLMFEGHGLDLQPEFGVSLNEIGPLSSRFFFRGRLGYIRKYEPWHIAIGATFEGVGLPSLAGGIQGELIYINGIWGQAGISFGEGPIVVMHIACGWSFAGVEWQHVTYGAEDGHTDAFLLKVKFPLGIFLMGSP